MRLLAEGTIRLLRWLSCRCCWSWKIGWSWEPQTRRPDPRSAGPAICCRGSIPAPAGFSHGIFLWIFPPKTGPSNMSSASWFFSPTSMIIFVFSHLWWMFNCHLWLPEGLRSTPLRCVPRDGGQNRGSRSGPAKQGAPGLRAALGDATRCPAIGLWHSDGFELVMGGWTYWTSKSQ